MKARVQSRATRSKSKRSLWGNVGGDQLDSAESARRAGLRLVSDVEPGIRRVRCGGGFRYVRANGRFVRDPVTLHRIKSLAVPPAWRDVWICPTAEGHLQATGRDSKGRKQFRYHTRWRQVRDLSKYDRMILFGGALPRIREQVARDLAVRGLPRKKVLAAIVRLLETTFIRVGNEEYARQNHSFGLTTLRENHLQMNGSTARLVFRGKSGKQHTVAVTDRALARLVHCCQSLPGEELFQYIDNHGQAHHVTSIEVNDYLREIAGQDFTAKDFRTWAGTVLAAEKLEECGPFQTKAEGKRKLVEVIRAVADELGNTPAICRKCYIHPAVFGAYLEGNLLSMRSPRIRRTKAERALALRPEEAKVLAFLQSISGNHSNSKPRPAISSKRCDSNGYSSLNGRAKRISRSSKPPRPHP